MTYKLSRRLSLVVQSAVISLGAHGSASDAPLALNDFLHQVHENHQGIQASSQSSEGAQLRSAESELLYSPLFFANGQISRDNRLNFFLQNNQSDLNTLTTGISKLTSFGTQAKLSYGYTYTYYSQFLDPRRTFPAFYQFQTQLEVNQSLWRNGFGAESRAQQKQIEAQALASHHMESYKTSLLMAEAEISYWRLALARQSVAVQTDALDRAKKIHEWNIQRAQRNLGDQGDVIQADALVKLRTLELQSSRDEERAASRAFNLARGRAEDLVSEKLEKIDQTSIIQMRPPVRTEKRADVLAAEQQERATQSAATLAVERTLPTFDLFGSYSLNGQKTELSEAFSGSFGFDQPIKAAGLRFSAPLDFGTTRATRSGWRKEAIAAELNFQRKWLEQESEWTDLERRLSEAKKRYYICQAIEEVQKNKLNHERDRLKRGRSTSFQVLQFEQDFSQSQLTRIRSQAEVLQILAKMKTFQAKAPSAAHP